MVNDKWIANRIEEFNGNQLSAYHELHDGLEDMIENDRILEVNIPDDYEWLMSMLIICAALGNVELEKPQRTACPECKEHELAFYAESGVPVLADGSADYDDASLELSESGAFFCRNCGTEFGDDEHRKMFPEK